MLNMFWDGSWIVKYLCHSVASLIDIFQDEAGKPRREVSWELVSRLWPVKSKSHFSLCPLVVQRMTK